MPQIGHTSYEIDDTPPGAGVRGNATSAYRTAYQINLCHAIRLQVGPDELLECSGPSPQLLETKLS
jgi:hypothetical protein